MREKLYIIVYISPLSILEQEVDIFCIVQDICYQKLIQNRMNCPTVSLDIHNDQLRLLFLYSNFRIDGFYRIPENTNSPIFHTVSANKV